MATLFGVVFLSHQLGSFTGVWLGGYLYDTVGSYDGVWWTSVVLGIAATVIHAVIDEKTLPRMAPAPARTTRGSAPAKGLDSRAGGDRYRLTAPSHRAPHPHPPHEPP